MARPVDSSVAGSRPGWAEMLGDPSLQLDAERAAVEAIRAWIGAAPATAAVFGASQPVLPADRYTWLDPAAPSTTPELVYSGT